MYSQPWSPTPSTTVITPDEALELRGLIEEHRERTGSPVAERLLDAWDEELTRFVKVMPHDYKRALLELTQEEVAA